MTGLDLTGKTALVTGGGTGIGLMIAKAFCDHGAKVYITGRRLEVLEATANRLNNERLVPLQMNIVNKDSIRNAVKVVDQNDGKLDILVNNAGILGQYFPYISDETAPEHEKMGDFLFEQGSFESWSEVLQTNTVAPYFVTMAFLTLLQRGAQSRPGETSSVISISSAGASMKLSNNNFTYPVSKAGTTYLSTLLATEFAIHKIPVRVNCIEPGIFPSELMSGTPEEIANLMQKPAPGAFSATPLLRAGKDEEIATMAVFLASSAGGFTTGAVMRIDGGLSLVNPPPSSICVSSSTSTMTSTSNPASASSPGLVTTPIADAKVSTNTNGIVATDASPGDAGGDGDGDAGGDGDAHGDARGHGDRGDADSAAVGSAVVETVE
ncbi:hypothetical protein D9758_016228 [Tetrapyrgos nigripes]|uniref:Uncharacterized protein n=1 Tax=Tetrapyrgos nigripes TaxID=182062 RepID=A0A8H5C5V0_9AGAR|nr:hypothetical protein D9758_016228 [Tetrapyrgos nigripes]